mmetsp:Transcript_35117/g.108404  ORF Transcript_35117/g.108404 Transcript_35117/m.108404 type:complete len:206 (-) Transcript_35117:523-1140(-)
MSRAASARPRLRWSSPSGAVPWSFATSVPSTLTPCSAALLERARALIRARVASRSAVLSALSFSIVASRSASISSGDCGASADWALSSLPFLGAGALPFFLARSASSTAHCSRIAAIVFSSSFSSDSRCAFESASRAASDLAKALSSARFIGSCDGPSEPSSATEMTKGSSTRSSARTMREYAAGSRRAMLISSTMAFSRSTYAS